MKNILLYGEFTPRSTTGIAYINSNLKESLVNLGNNVFVLNDPRTEDYFKNEKIIRRNLNIYKFIKLFSFFLSSKIYDISFITISMGNLGLLKTALVQFLLNLKSKRSYLYIHRGDLDNAYFNSSFYKKIMISMILENSFKIIFLSKIFENNNRIKNIKNKIIVLPNALCKNDCLLSRRLFRKKVKNKKKYSKIINLLFCGNIQKDKGINKILEAIDAINFEEKAYNIKLDIYGMKFENINLNYKFIEYKGKLDTNKRLEKMSQYDCLILASNNEGLPMILIESLSIGLPFITSKVGAIDDLLIENYPYICEVNIDSIKNKINEFCSDLLDNKDKLNRIITDNNKLFIKKFKYSIFEKNIKKFIV
tara:strand:+ start:26 stop:1120 length:1095 start_codon:yes stop_codon:yes gene_type:complete